MFEEYAALTPLRDAAELLATHEWPRLSDPEILRGNGLGVDGERIAGYLLDLARGER